MKEATTYILYTVIHLHNAAALMHSSCQHRSKLYSTFLHIGLRLAGTHTQVRTGNLEQVSRADECKLPTYLKIPKIPKPHLPCRCISQTSS
jgi:hypothetical protein